MKDTVILANAGHFNIEIAVSALERQSLTRKDINEHTVQYDLNNGHRIYLIGEGRLVNLAAAEGPPSEVMDMSFSNQFLSVLRLVNSRDNLKPVVYDIERAQDQEIAMAKLESMGIEIDMLTSDQKTYLEGFSEGT